MRTGASPLEKEEQKPRRGGRKSARGSLGRTNKKLSVVGGQKAGGGGWLWPAGEGERPRSIPRLRSLSLTVSLGVPSKGSRWLGSLLVAPLFPYLVFQPFPHSPASSAAPEVTRNSRTAQRQKGSAGAGESVPMRLTAPACGRERSKHLPEAVEVRSFPGLPLSEYSRARFKEASNTGLFSTL